MQRKENESPREGERGRRREAEPRSTQTPTSRGHGTRAMSAHEATGARLRDGSPVTIRLSKADDEPALREFLSELCLEARRLRFFTGAVDLDQAAHLSAEAGSDRIGLLAFDEDGALVGHALCIRIGTQERGRAEVALEVADDLHGLGLGTILVERLAEIAERDGLAAFVAEVLPENDAMLDVFRNGFDADVKWREGIERVEFPTSAWRVAHERAAV
jgi:GNAT superfamily N-acetyltransferase